VSAPGGPQPDQQGGGAWGRVIAGTVDTSSSSTGTVDFSATPIGSVTGTQNCNTATRQDYWGWQVGHDISILNAGGTGANWHFGVTAGFLSANTKDVTPASSFFQPSFGVIIDTPAGTFREESFVPFVGLYTAFTKGNFAFDGQVRWDFYQNSLSDALNGLTDQRLDARGFSVTGNAAYNIPLGGNWFMEPSVGAVWSRTEINPLDVAGITPPGFTFPISRGTVVVDDIESLLGRLSLSIGTSVQHGGAIWQPFFTASVYHEFLGDVTARATIGNSDPSLNGAILTLNSSGGVGTYAQLALGSAVVLGNSGWLGYGRVDYRKGEDIESWSVNAGLRYQFTPVANRGSVKDGHGPPNTTPAPDFAGHLLGGQVGYNLQHGRVVYGIEADYGFSNARGGVSCPNQFIFTCEGEMQRLASIAGRLGITWGRALFYAKGGVAFGEVTASIHDNPVLVPPVGLSDTKWMTGWIAGGGMEFALTDRWSAKAEYQHYDLGKKTFTTFDGTLFPGPLTGQADVDVQGDSVRIGINYHLQAVRDPAPLK
jgi:opacity protein-like surface antigen